MDEAQEGEGEGAGRGSRVVRLRQLFAELRPGDRVGRAREPVEVVLGEVRQSGLQDPRQEESGEMNVVIGSFCLPDFHVNTVLALEFM